MTATAIKQDAITFLRPGGTVSTTLSNSLVAWVQNYVLTPLYRLRRWYWLQQTPVLSTINGQSTYTPALVGASEIIYAVSATYGNVDLLLPPLAQAAAFYAGSGPPEGVALVPANPITQVQVFPTPDAGSPYTIRLAVTCPLAALADDGVSHNYLTDEFPGLVLSAMCMIGFLALQEDGLFRYWWDVYAGHVRTLATYDHEVRRGGTMPEPMEPYVPTFAGLTPSPPQPAAAAAGAG